MSKFFASLSAWLNGRVIAPARHIYSRVKIFRVVMALFIVFMLFLDDSSVIKNIGYQFKIRELQREIGGYRKIIDDSIRKLGELNSDPENLEKFAREQFLMKKDNEDIYLVE